MTGTMSKAVVNCKTCLTGRDYWLWLGDKWHCTTCDGNPLVANSGRPDWVELRRARMVAMFGARVDGDMELVKKYANELRGYDRAIPLESLDIPGGAGAKHEELSQVRRTEG